MTNDNGKDTVSDDPKADESNEDAEFPELEAPLQVQPARTGRTAMATALLALILSIAASLGVGWLAMRETPAPTRLVQENPELQQLAAAAQANDAAIAQLGQRLESLADQDAAAKRRLDDIRRQLENQLERQLGQYESLPGRMQNLEGTMASIQGISAGVRDNWLLAEAEYYMQIANAQLQLASNPRLARLALLQADERLQQLANPALTNIRRELASELRALEVMDRPDVEGVTLTLASLAAVVDSLPLRRDVEAPAVQDLPDNDDLSGLDRAMQSLKDTMTDVVSVRRVDEDVRPLIAPEAAYFLRGNLSLQLQTARLALLRSETAVFQQSLDDSADWIEEYYDTDSTQVTGALTTIAEIRDSLFDIETPDISQSLRLLRQYSRLSGATADPAARDDQPDLESAADESPADE